MKVSALIVASTTLTLILVGQPVGSQVAVPVGDQIQINTYTTFIQNIPAVGVEADGDFVVVWMSYGSSGNDSSGFSVQGQRYDSNGQPVDGEFQVNSYTTSGQQDPAVGLDDKGNFVVVWMSYGSGDSDSSDFSIQGQRYDSNGQTVDGEFQVNSYTGDDQLRPSVATDADGDFVVVWMSYGSSGSDSSEFSIQGQRYDSNGLPVDGEFEVNSYTTSSQSHPAVAVDADGDFIVVWNSNGSSDSDNSGDSIQGQRFDSNGQPVGGEFQVNSYTGDDQRRPAVATDTDGDFVVVWMSYGSSGSDSSDSSIQGQRYDSDGHPVDGEFQVNTYTTGDQWFPAVGVDDEGNFVVVWDSYLSGGTDSGYSIQGRIYTSTGMPIGPEGQVNTYTPNTQTGADVRVDKDGNFVVVWESWDSGGSDTSYSSIQGQRFTSPFIFADGFESGDTMRWSGSVP